MKTNFKDLTDKQRCILVKLKLKDEGFFHKDLKITTIVVDSITKDGFICKVCTNNYSPHLSGMVLSKFTLSQIEYLLTEKLIEL